MKLTITRDRGKTASFLLPGPYVNLNDSWIPSLSHKALCELALLFPLSPSTSCRVQPTESPLSGEDIFNCPPSVNFPIHFFLAALAHILPEMIKVPSLYFPTPCSQNMGMRSNPSPQNLNRNVMEGFSIPAPHTHAHTPLQYLSGQDMAVSTFEFVAEPTLEQSTCRILIVS